MSKRGINFTGTTSLVQQQFKKECDINTIVRRFKRTGIVPPEALQRRAAAFADVSDVGDFHSNMQKLVNAQRAFEELPAVIRDRFANQPAQLLNFLADEANHKEAIELGILPAPQTVPETTVEPPTVPPKEAKTGS